MPRNDTNICLSPTKPMKGSERWGEGSSVFQVGPTPPGNCGKGESAGGKQRAEHLGLAQEQVCQPGRSWRRLTAADMVGM